MKLLLRIAAVIALPIAASAQVARSQDHFDSALLLMRNGDLQAAANELRAALQGDLQPPLVVGWSHYYLGEIFDATNQHDRAMQEYFSALCTEEAGSAAAGRLRNSGFSDKDFDRRCGRATVPKVVEKTVADYTDEARIAELEGSVMVFVTVGEDGVAHEFQVTRSLGLGLDEQAIAAAKNWRFEPSIRQGRAEARKIPIAVDFFLGAKQSRWHLIAVSFDVSEGATRPVFAQADFPRGDGIFGRNAYEEGRLVGAIGRSATATLQFEIDEEGRPGKPAVKEASENVWGPEGIAVIQGWRFKPAMKDGKAVPARCTVELLWGPQEINSTIATGYSLPLK